MCVHHVCASSGDVSSHCRNIKALISLLLLLLLRQPVQPRCKSLHVCTYLYPVSQPPAPFTRSAYSTPLPGRPATATCHTSPAAPSCASNQSINQCAEHDARGGGGT